MGLSKRKPHTNIEILRSDLNRLNVEANDTVKKEDVSSFKQPITGGSLIREAKRRGRKRNEVVDGNKLLTC